MALVLEWLDLVEEGQDQLDAAWAVMKTRTRRYAGAKWDGRRPARRTIRRWIARRVRVAAPEDSERVVGNLRARLALEGGRAVSTIARLLNATDYDAAAAQQAVELAAAREVLDRIGVTAPAPSGHVAREAARRHLPPSETGPLCDPDRGAVMPPGVDAKP